MNKLQIDLTADETRLVIHALSRLPYHQVSGLIATIEAQAREQLPFNEPEWSDDTSENESLINDV